MIACSGLHQCDKKTSPIIPRNSTANPAKRIAAESEESQNEREISFWCEA